MNRVEMVPGTSNPLSLENVWVLLSGAFAISIPFFPGFNSALSMALLLGWFFLPKRLNSKENGVTVLAASMPFWIAVAGMTYTSNLEEGMFRLQQKALLLLLPLIFLTVRIDPRRLVRTVMSLYVLGVGIACAASLSASLYDWGRTGDPKNFTGHDLARFLDLYPYVFALLCLVAQVILVYSWRGDVALYTWFGRRFRIALGLLMVVCMLLLAVQQVIMIWFVLTVVYAWISLRQRIWLIAVVASLLIVLAISVVSVPPLKEKVTDLISGSQRNTIPLDHDGPMQQEWNGIGVRKAIWICAWDLILDNPVFGVGTGDGQDELQRAYARRKFQLAALYNRYNAHNQYLQMLVCAGAAGLAAWVFSIVWLLRKFSANRVFLFSFAAIMLSMLTESMLETNKGNLIMAFVLSVLLLPAHPKEVSNGIPG